MQFMFPAPKPARVLVASEDLKLNLSTLDPATVHLFAYPLTPAKRIEFLVSAVQVRM